MNLFKKIFLKGKNSIKISLILIMIGTLFSKILGLLRDSILASYFGATIISDAYIISTTIPAILIGSIAEAILTTYIPMYNNIKSDEKYKTIDNNTAEKFTNNVINLLISIITIFLIIYFIFQKQIVSLFVLGFEGENLKIVLNMTNITIFSSYFLVIIAILSGYLQNKGKFKATSFYGIIFNGISILGIFLASRFGYALLSYTFVLGYAISTIVLFVSCLKQGFKYSCKINIKDKNLKKLFFSTIPVILNSIIWDINVVIDKSLTSTIGEGYVSALNYSSKIVNVATGIITTSIVIYIFPKISKLFQSNENIKVGKLVTKSINLIVSLLIPIATFISIFSVPIVKILFFRGKFDINDLNITSTSLKIYAITLVFIGINTVLYKVFNARMQNKIPAKNAVISIGINIVLNLILIGPFGYKGVIISTAISTIIATILIIIRCIKEHISIEYKTLIKTSLKCIVSTIITSICSLLIFNMFNGYINTFLNICITGIIFSIIYIISMYVFRMKLTNIKINMEED